MAVVSSLSQDLTSRNKDSEPKKKLKKTRSIRLSKVPSMKPSSRRSKSRFNWQSIDLNDSSSLLDFSDAGPDYMKDTNSFDAKKDSSQQGGSEIEDSTSSNASTPLSNLNQTTRIQKMLKNYRVSGSFRRHSKSRTVQAQVGSPNYLKATSSSDGRKANSQASSRNSSSLFENSDDSSSHISTPPKSVKKSSQTLARTSSMKSVRIQLNKISPKPKRASFKSSQNSEELNVDRATCSSTFKDKKFPDQVDGNAAERKSTMKVCPYQHCSLHGHNRNAEPSAKHSSSKTQQSLKTQTNMKPDTNAASVANVSGDKKHELFKLSSDLELSSRDVGVHGGVCSPGKKGKGVSFSIEIHAKITAQFSSKTEEETGDSEASEITLGESSCFLDSQKESLNEMMSTLIKSLSDLKEKSVGCRCKSEVHEPTTYDQNEDRVEENLTDIPLNSEAQVNKPKFDDVTEKRNPSTIFEDSDTGSTKPLDTSAGENTRNTLEPVLTRSRDIDDNMSIPVEDPEYSSHHEGFRAKLSGGKNISMWQLIHQQMISGLASDVEGSLPQTENEENQVEDTKKLSDVIVSVDTAKQEDKDNQSDDKMNQDIELRKVLAIKLVREAIEKILLPEVPDQSLDDQSTTSETTTEQDLSEQIHPEEYLKESKREIEASNDTKESGPCDGNQQLKTLKRLENKSEKKAPKHWSNLKKWIILQRFVKALEKLKKFNPRGPRYLELEPEPEGEKVALRPQTVEEKKNAEEWMFDYALRKAVSQLAPTQKKKVALLVKAFETVVPPQEDSDIHSTISKLKENSDKSRTKAEKHEDSLPKRNDTKPESVASPLTEPATSADPLTSSIDTIVEEGDRKVIDGRRKLPQGPYLVEPSSNENEEEKKNHINMWHMLYHHVVSSIVEKVGAKILDGTDDEDSEDATELPKTLKTDQNGELETYAALHKSGFSRIEAVKLVQEEVDEILLPEFQDDLSETQSVTSDTVSDQEISEKSQLEDQGVEILKHKISNPPKTKNWSKLKKLMILKRSIRALEKARNPKSQLQSFMQSKGDPQAETVDLRRQKMDEKKKAEQWMLDYAVQNVVHTLTPARKRRVQLLVEAFEAVVPFPEM